MVIRNLFHWELSSCVVSITQTVDLAIQISASYRLETLAFLKGSVSPEFCLSFSGSLFLFIFVSFSVTWFCFGSGGDRAIKIQHLLEISLKKTKKKTKKEISLNKEKDHHPN